MSAPSRHALIFVDEVSLSTLIRALLLVRRDGTIRYFDGISVAAQVALEVTRTLRLHRLRWEPVRQHVGEVRDASGTSAYVSLLRGARETCREIRRDLFTGHPLISALGGLWREAVVEYHLDRSIEPYVRRERFRIALCGWLLRRVTDGRLPTAPLLVRRTRWCGYLVPHAQAEGVQLIVYQPRWRSGLGLPAVTRVSRAGLGAVTRLARKIGARWHVESATPTWPRSATAPRIGVRYGHQRLSLDAAERSELFWLDGSGLEPNDLMIYDYDQWPRPDEVADLTRLGARVVGTGRGAPRWQPTSAYLLTAARVVVRILLSAVVTRSGGFLLRRLLGLALDYSYWSDFFRANRVLVNIVAMTNGTAGQVLAMESLRGVTMSYQYSVSNILGATTLLAAGEDVQFVTSSAFADLWRALQLPSRRIVRVGFVYDRALEAIRSQPRIPRLRARLRERGCVFILCFFDENSVDRWDVPASNAEAAADYEFLLRWLADDPDLGLVFKPKKRSNLFERLGPAVAQRLQLALGGGRCILLGDDEISSGHLAEAAQVADLCMGKLVGSTAAFEARSAGVPSVLVDTECLRDHPLRGRLPAGVIFDTWEALRGAVEEHRRGGRPELGDWSVGIDVIDPDRDGHAARRMGKYIGAVFQGLRAGLAPAGALARADQTLPGRVEIP